MEKVIKRIKPHDLAVIRQGNLSMCKNLRFFMQYPETVQEKLLEIAEYIHIPTKNTNIFSQGDKSDGYYVIVRGTVKIEQKCLKYADKADMPAVVIRTCYDGDQFGEVSHFTKNLEKMNSLIGIDTSTQEQLALKNLRADQSMFERKLRVSDDMLKDLSNEEVDKLNQQRTTATTCESCDLLFINKLQSMFIIGKGMQDDLFQERLKFLWTIDLFKSINRNHLLPLITNLDIRFFRKGQYI